MDQPELMEIPGAFPEDVIARAKAYLKSANGSVGAYTMSQGLPLIREQVAEYITNRDQQGAASPNQIFLSDGASSGFFPHPSSFVWFSLLNLLLLSPPPHTGIKLILELLIRSSSDGVMVPIPQYPLYSASLARMNGTLVPVFLDPEERWALNTTRLDGIFEDSIKSGVLPRGLVVINPGNPTGQCLSEENMEEIVDFCGRRGLVLLADEVYQVWLLLLLFSLGVIIIFFFFANYDPIPSIGQHLH